MAKNHAQQHAPLDPFEAAKVGNASQNRPSGQNVSFAEPLTPVEEPEVANPASVGKLPVNALTVSKPKEYRVLEKVKLSCGGQMVHLMPGKIISNSTNPDLMRRVLAAGVKIEEVR